MPAPQFAHTPAKIVYAICKWLYLLCLIAYLPALAVVIYFGSLIPDTAKYAEGFFPLFLLFLYATFPLYLAFMVLGQLIRHFVLVGTQSLSVRSAMIGAVLRILAVVFTVLTIVSLILWFVVGIFLNTDLLYFILYIVFALIAIALAFWKWI